MAISRVRYVQDHIYVQMVVYKLQYSEQTANSQQVTVSFKHAYKWLLVTHDDIISKIMSRMWSYAHSLLNLPSTGRSLLVCEPISVYNGRVFLPWKSRVGLQQFKCSYIITQFGCWFFKWVSPVWRALHTRGCMLVVYRRSIQHREAAGCSWLLWLICIIPIIHIH